MTNVDEAQLALDKAISEGEIRARELAADIIVENPSCSELEISILFAEQWARIAEAIGEELLSRGLRAGFEELYPRLTRIGAHVLAELHGLSSKELLAYARRWCCDAREVDPGVARKK